MTDASLAARHATISGPVFVSGEVARRVFRWEDAIKAIQDCYAEEFSPSAAPPRTVARDAGGWMRILPAMPPGRRYFGAKIMAMTTAADKPAAQYVTVLFDRESSAIAGFVDANVVTGFRTAATSAAALDRLAPAGPIRLGVIGSGLEASMHIRAFGSIRPLTEVLIYSPTQIKREALADLLSAELGVSCRAASTPQEAVGGASVVLTAARSRGEQPILYGDWLGDGAIVVSIGSTVPEQREIDVSVVARADLIICDAVDEVVEDTGDMIEAARAGIQVADKVFSMNALLRGELGEQLKASRAPMFKSVGGGLQDVVVAEVLLTNALREGFATVLPLRFENKVRS